jgi:hypothetical protein
MSDEKTQQDLAFLNDRAQWPDSGTVCLKRYRAQYTPPECGFILADAPLVVVLGNVFGIAMGGKPEGVAQYESLEAMLQDGWMVD